MCRYIYVCTYIRPKNSSPPVKEAHYIKKSQPLTSGDTIMQKMKKKGPRIRLYIMYVETVNLPSVIVQRGSLRILLRCKTCITIKKIQKKRLIMITLPRVRIVSWCRFYILLRTLPLGRVVHCVDKNGSFELDKNSLLHVGCSNSRQ